MSDELTYAALRARGIGHAQRVSGTLWTDYNLHDPGVTQLEAFCYALTELGYRADFPVAHLLSDPDGAVELEKLGLHPPRRALPTRPVTATDLALALAKDCPDAQRVLVYPAARTEECDLRGLWDIHVVPADGAENEAIQGLALTQVRSRYFELRNLCEDLGEIHAAEPIECRLVAKVEVRRRSKPETLAALIYERCYRLLVDQALSQPETPVTRQEVFDHPERMFGSKGPHSPEAGGTSPAGAVSLDPFYLALSQIDGVEDVTSLRFERVINDKSTGEDPFDTPLKHGQYRRLLRPRESPGGCGLEFSSRGLGVAFDIGETNKELMRLRSQIRARRSIDPDTAEWDRKPEGKRRDFSHQRLGNLLPPFYGVGQDLPAPNTNAQHKRAARQLRSFLGFSDAVLSNAAADLAALPDLFGAKEVPPRSYEVRSPDFGDDPGLRRIDPGELDAISMASDPWRDRKGRALNYLLSLYGEALTQNSLQAHDVYRTGEARLDRVLENRAKFLSEVAVLAENRGAGADVAAAEPSDQIGMGRKLAILLDMPDRGQAALAAGLRLGPEEPLPTDKLIKADALVLPDDPLDTLVPETPIPTGPGQGKNEDTALQSRPPRWGVLQKAGLATTNALAAETLHPWIFRRAAEAKAYVTGQEKGEVGWGVYLIGPDGAAQAQSGADKAASDLPTQPVLVRLGRAETRAEAIADANRLRHEMIGLNRACEGLYLVEDILLRGSGSVDARVPESGHGASGGRSDAGLGDPAPETNLAEKGKGGKAPRFDALSLYVVFSGWSARTHARAFRELAEETVAIVCPAHLRHSILWLDQAEMTEFERLHLNWRITYRDWAPKRQQDPVLDRYATDLRAFLKKKSIR